LSLLKALLGSGRGAVFFWLLRGRRGKGRREEKRLEGEAETKQPLG
jgi:hypothetical protein